MTYLSTTCTPAYNLMHDAARRWVVIAVSQETGMPVRVLSRHETRKGAAISCGKAIARAKRG